MGPGQSKSQSEKKQERLRQFQKLPPTHFCSRCSNVLYEEDERCLDCDERRPEEGWPALANAGDPWLGKIVQDRYLVTKLLAVSDSARIYRADSRIIPRSFAIKVMDVRSGPRLDRDGLRRRLTAEVEALSSLRNPHLVGFYDVVELEEHIAFIMDLVDGLPLDRWMAEHGRAHLPQALALLRQLANGVFEAHEQGLVHRSLKPSNVMIEKLPAGDDFVRILDFGVVWVRGTVSTTGAYDETPVFASPEQIRDEPTDLRTDIYSIGALAYYLIAGRPPFTGTNIVEAVDAILTEEPRKLSDVRKRFVPGPIERFVAHLLAKSPRDRPQSLADVIETLDDLIDDALNEPVTLDDIEDFLGTSGATSLGLIPTLGDASSPVLTVDRSEMSDISEVQVDEPVLHMSCRGRNYAFLRDGNLCVVRNGITVEVAFEPDAEVASMEMGPSWCVFGLENGTIVRVHFDGTIEEMFQDPRRAPMTAISTDQTGETMVAGSESGRLYGWSESTGWGRLGASEEPVFALTLNAKGDQFAIGRGSAIQMMSLTSSHAPTFPLPVKGLIRSLAFSSDDYLIAVLTDRGEVVLESVLTGQEFLRVETNDPNLLDISFSDDNDLLGVFAEDGGVKLRKLT